MVFSGRTGRKPLTILVVCAILVALAIAGCGGGSSTAASRQGSQTATSTASAGSTSATGADATASFIAQADAICRGVNAELTAGSAKRAESSLSNIARVATRNAAIERKGLAKLEALTVPGAIPLSWQGVLAKRTALSKQLAELAADARRKDNSAIQALGVTKKRVHAELRKAAKKGGFKDCAKVGSS